MSASEIETSINWLGDDEVITIFTNEKKIISHCQKLGLAGHIYFEPDNVWKFIVPRDQFKFGVKRKMNLSDEERHARGVRLQQGRENTLMTNGSDDA